MPDKERRNQLLDLCQSYNDQMRTDTKDMTHEDIVFFLESHITAISAALEAFKKGIKADQTVPAESSCNIRDIVPGDYVKVEGGKKHKIVSIWGVYADGTLAPPSQGGFGVRLESGREITMWEARSYHKAKYASGG